MWQPTCVKVRLELRLIDFASMLGNIWLQAWNRCVFMMTLVGCRSPLLAEET